jgi:tryptophan aminotransferase
MLSMLAGKPNPDLFPLVGITLSAREPAAAPGAAPATLPLDPAHLAAGLQYGGVAGWQPFLDWVAELQRREHGRALAQEGWRLTCGLGSNDLIYKAIIAIVNPGEPVFVESPTFAYVRSHSRCLGVWLTSVE